MRGLNYRKLTVLLISWHLTKCHIDERVVPIVPILNFSIPPFWYLYIKLFYHISGTWVSIAPRDRRISRRAPLSSSSLVREAIQLAITFSERARAGLSGPRMLAIDDQMTGPNWLKFLEETHGYSGEIGGVLTTHKCPDFNSTLITLNIRIIGFKFNWLNYDLRGLKSSCIYPIYLSYQHLIMYLDPFPRISKKFETWFYVIFC